MPLLNGSNKEVIASNISELRKSGRDEKQATAMAFGKAKGKSKAKTKAKSKSKFPFNKEK